MKKQRKAVEIEAGYSPLSSNAGGLHYFGAHPKDYGLSKHHWFVKNKWRFRVSLESLLARKVPLVLDNIQGGCGVYFLFLGDSLQYVGQSKNIQSRLSQHICSMRPILPIADWFDSLAAIWVPRDFLDTVEGYYITTFKPPRNDQQRGLTERGRILAGIRASHKRKIPPESRRLGNGALVNQLLSSISMPEKVPSSALATPEQEPPT